jgi:CheY-like chemotaxis protein
VEAIEKLSKEAFDLLISDFRMLRMSGFELLRWCREHDFHFPVIFVTANKVLFPEERIALDDC